VLLFALLAAAALAAKPARLTAWLRIFTGAGLLASLYLCLQYLGFDPLLPAEAYRIGEGEWSIVRPPGLLGHAGYAATFSLHAVFASLALILVDRRQWSRTLGWTTFIAASASVVLSGTRGALLGLLVGAALLVGFLRPRVRAWQVGACAVALLGCAAFYYSPMGQELRSRVRWSTEDPMGGARVQLWRDSARMGADRWLTGWGPEVFPQEFPRHQSRGLAQAYPDFYHESPHNIFIEAWTAQGAAGLAILVGFCVLGFRAMRRSPVATALCAGLAAAVVSQLFLSFTAATALCFYLTIAMLVASSPAVEAVAEAAPRSRIPYAGAAAASLLLVVYATALLVSDRMLVLADRELAEGRIREGAASYERARRWQPLGVNTDLWYSRSLFEAARRSPNLMEGGVAVRSALEAARRATLHAEDRHNAFYSLAALSAVQGDLPQVEAYLRQAIAAAPNWFKPHWTLAEALLLAGRNQEAHVEAAKAVDLDGGKHSEVFKTLQKLNAQR
jgi:O-antigen ligase